MKDARVLIVDDDPAIRKFIRANLEARDYEVLLAPDGEAALTLLEKEKPDLIILDIMMPNIDGFEVCRRVREWSKVPIIMLSARDGEMDKVKCLDCGADDYMTKPFSLKELLSRIAAVLRRSKIDSNETTQSKFQYEDLEVDFSRNTVSVRGENINLTACEFKILNYLAQNAGRIITPNQILQKVWGEEYFGDLRILQVNICRLRRKLNDDAKNPVYIQTKPGIGYTIPKSESKIDYNPTGQAGNN
jgi:DNA-binding response OmpR family regulator